MNKKSKIGLIFALLAGFMVFGQIFGMSDINIIPKPDEVIKYPGEFRLNSGTLITISQEDDEIKSIASYLQERILAPIGYKLKISTGVKKRNSINIVLDPDFKSVKGGYELIVKKQSILIRASETIGCFYGVQTLCQLFPAEFESRVTLKYPNWIIPCLKIKDFPRFSYRGLHLDVGRHFFPVSFIKKYIDLIAKYKLNTFHWHLTEDQGWRIEIKKYPKLTQIGSYRKETLIGHGAKSENFDGKPYGGFYTQKEVREIVKYAKSRFITIIPEIEMPGHSRAALAAYPEIGCTGGPYEVATKWGVFEDVYCAGKEQTFEFLEDVLTEVMELFPGKYIHIGGDESPKESWKKCKHCQKRIKNEGLKDEHELQSYFIKRIEKFLISKGKRLIGWDEILEGGLAPEATVMSWRGIQGGLAAARSKHQVIMTPNKNCYFDHYQASAEFEPLGIGGYMTLKKLYNYEPIPEELEEKYHSFILGAQGNVWTEYMPNSDHVEYMVLPRLCALAELVWTKRQKMEWDDFNERVQDHFKRFAFGDYKFSRGTFKIEISVEFDHKNGTAKVKLDSDQYRPVIRYTTDGSVPDKNSRIYQSPFKIKKLTNIKAGIFRDGKLVRGLTEKTIGIHKGVGKDAKLTKKYSYKYKAGGNDSVIDGLTGSKMFNDGFWQGYEGVDFGVIIDLKKQMQISKIRTNFFKRHRSWIFLPKYISFEGSIDGKKYYKIKKFKNTMSKNKNEEGIRIFKLQDLKKSYRYIKVFAKNIEFCPKGHPGEGGKAWLFIDEIIIE